MSNVINDERYYHFIETNIYLCQHINHEAAIGLGNANYGVLQVTYAKEVCFINHSWRDYGQTWALESIYDLRFNL